MKLLATVVLPCPMWRANFGYRHSGRESVTTSCSTVRGSSSPAEYSSQPAISATSNAAALSGLPGNAHLAFGSGAIGLRHFKEGREVGIAEGVAQD